ncbi:uracil-DNA glycosylase [bacterium]|nr:uracil-DNA glycosylase [bacterium]
MSTKRDILNYLEFLKKSGFLYMDGESLPLAPVETVAEPPKKKKPAASAPARVVAPPAPQPPAKKPAPADPAAKVERLAELAREAEKCQGCPLHKTRNKSVFADGEATAKIVFVGEAPGGDEDIQGKPFVGRAGQLLNKMIAAIGFKREEVYICNTLKCRPPENRDPSPGEKKACERFLVEQLEILHPDILVALGAHAANFLCGTDISIGRLRGKWHSYHGVPLLATYHPAFLLRSPGMKGEAWKDFQAIHKKYCELNPGDLREIWTKQ